MGSDTDPRKKPMHGALSTMMPNTAPNSFALMVWLHFQAQPDACADIQAIMDGPVFFDHEPP